MQVSSPDRRYRSTVASICIERNIAVPNLVTLAQAGVQRLSYSMHANLQPADYITASHKNGKLYTDLAAAHSYQFQPQAREMGPRLRGGDER